MHLIQRQKLATRLYTVSFILSLLVVLTFTGLNVQIESITSPFPSESLVEELRDRYLSSVYCPCSQIAIEYSTFLLIKPSAYHQVCSSYFISPSFIALLWGDDSSDSYRWNMDMKILSAEFRLLAMYCSLAKNATNQALDAFRSRELITTEVLTSKTFQTEIDSIVTSFIKQLPLAVRETNNLVIEILRINQLQTVFNTNWNPSISTSAESYILRTTPVSYNTNNISCSCETMSTCSRSDLKYYDNDVSFSGFVIGCLPSHGLRLSTLECLYDAECLTTIWNELNYNTEQPSPLNASMTSRFTPISSTFIGTLIDELFIEGWENASNYSNYFTQCSPATCEYTIALQNSALYMLTTFLGIYGGLTVGLRYFVWYGLIVIVQMKQWCFSRISSIKPINENY